MSNLTVENLNRISQLGDTESLLSRSVQGVSSKNPTSSTEQLSEGKTFSSILKDSFDKTNLYQSQADQAIKELVAGRNKNIHETMLTIERADTSLKLMMQVRNKILDAYKEIIRMQV